MIPHAFNSFIIGIVHRVNRARARFCMRSTIAITATYSSDIPMKKGSAISRLPGITRTHACIRNPSRASTSASWCCQKSLHGTIRSVYLFFRHFRRCACNGPLVVLFHIFTSPGLRRLGLIFGFFYMCSFLCSCLWIIKL